MLRGRHHDRVTPLRACVDVAYSDERARAACVLFQSWTDAAPTAVVIAESPLAAPYVPGELYRRELPPILDVLARVTEPLDAIVVDGFVWLGPSGPGLGARLHAALGERVPVIGVAKTSWAESAQETVPERRTVEVRRGQSQRPLFVTAVGVAVADAAAWIGSMAGEARLPLLLQRADAATRGR